MIRLIQRRLIIPRGDTGSFSIPTIGTVNQDDIAIFGIFDPLTHETVVMKKITANQDYLTVILNSEDTINLEPRKYNWDITIYKSPQYDEDGELIGAAETSSYYSAFKLPICEITEVALDMNKERWKTRDLLLETNNFQVANSIQTVYPWENAQLTILAQQIYKIAQNMGYTEDIQSFYNHFNEGTVIITNMEELPPIGNPNKLYLDKTTGILYYFVSTANIVYHELANAVGAIITTPENEVQTITNLYIPIKALPIENLIINGGEV